MTTLAAPVVPGRVSVVVPCFPAAAFIRRAVQSVLAQTHPDVELILVDDCSGDDLVSALAGFAGRVVLSRNPSNVGTSASRNNGARLATGETLAFLDQDDWWPPDLLASLASVCVPGTAACYDNHVLGDGDIALGEAVWQTRPTVFAHARPWNHARVEPGDMDVMFHGAPMLKLLVRRDDFERAGGYDARFYGVEDFHFAVKLLASGTSLALAPTVRGYYLDHAASTSAAIKTDKARQARACAVWLLMSRTMPQELALTPAAAQACRRGEQYWALRSVDLRLQSLVRQKQFAGLLRLDFLRAALPVLPALAVQKTGSLLRKLRARLPRLPGKAGTPRSREN